MEPAQYAVVGLGLAHLISDLSRGRKLHGDASQDAGTCTILVASLMANMCLGWVFVFVDLGQILLHRQGWQGVGLAVGFVGVALRLGAMRQLGADFTWELRRSGDATLVTEGLFRWMRHPSYTGGLLAGTGLLLGLGNLIPVAVFLCTHTWAVAHRVRVEERLLRLHHGAAFDAYAARTGALFPSGAFSALFAPLLVRCAPLTRRFNDVLARGVGVPPLPGGVPELPALPLWGNMRERLANPAGLVERTRDLGDIVAFRAGPVPVVLLHNPSEVETFLQTRARVFTRGLGFEVLKPVLGDGLFTCPENVWKPQRRLAQVSLQTRHVEAAAPLLTSIARTWIARHTAGAPGGRARVDMKTEGSLLALEGYFRAQMGLHRPEDYPRLVEATDALKRNAHERLHALFLRSTGWPTRSNRALRRWRRYLIGLADTLAAQRPEIAGNCGFLATHVDALAAGHDALPSRERLREQIITFLVTGHETVAATLALGLQSLAFHPRVQDALREECDAAFSAHGAEGCQTADVVSNLPYLDAVVREMLRLFPAAWLMSKQAVEEVTLGGHVFPPGTVFAAVPYSVHRDPRFWSEPDVFLPERFLRGEPTRRFAWFPFGAGPRACIGGAFATLELKVLLFHLVRELTIAPVEAKPIPPEFSVTLKPMSGLPLAIATRNPTP